ncbi:MAG: type II toxin-antitoxin system RelE/ParE family toxin, partial [Acidimicrobiales bacterium]
VVVRLTEPAVDDLEGLNERNPQAVRWALKKMLLLERNPEAGEELHKELVGWRKLVVGNRDWRVVWRVTFDESGGVAVDVAEVWAVRARSEGEVYAEMQSLVASLPRTPQTVALSDVVERLGKVAEEFDVTPEPIREEVPDWLINLLVNTVGLPRSEVEQMSLHEAVDTWGEWQTQPR